MWSSYSERMQNFLNGLVIYKSCNFLNDYLLLGKKKDCYTHLNKFLSSSILFLGVIAPKKCSWERLCWSLVHWTVYIKIFPWVCSWPSFHLKWKVLIFHIQISFYFLFKKVNELYFKKLYIVVVYLLNALYVIMWKWTRSYLKIKLSYYKAFLAWARNSLNVAYSS